MKKLAIFDKILMPEPSKDDSWFLGGFVATVIDIDWTTGLAIAEDQDSDFFTIEIDRAEKALIDENNL